MCEFVGWCALGTADWVGALGSILGGLGAAAAAWISVSIARSVRRDEARRRKIEATSLLRLFTSEVGTLPMKLNRYADEIEIAKGWWGDLVRLSLTDPPPELINALGRLAEADLLPYATASLSRLSVLDDVGHASISHDVSTIVGFVGDLADAAKHAKLGVEDRSNELQESLPKLLNQLRYLRDLSTQLANEIRGAAGLPEYDYARNFRS